MSYYSEREAEKQKVREELHSHEAFVHAYWNADADEIRELCATWDAIKAYGVPSELIAKMFEHGYTSGVDNEADNHSFAETFLGD